MTFHVYSISKRMENPKLTYLLLCLLLASAYLFPSSVHGKKHINNVGQQSSEEEESDGAALLKGKRIIDKRFRFPNVGEYAKSDVDYLGHHAGYYKLNRSHDARLFYFFFESRSNKTTDPVVIWLSGGPGCSSEIAMFYENGPFLIADNMSLHWNDFGWDKVSNLLYVDQPVGTGFSYTSDKRDIRHSEHGVSNDLYDFLQAFFEEHPEFVKNDFYITGESYAGHYIPALAERIHQANKHPKQGNIHINLKGFAIGNGFTDPAIQYKAYADYALDMKIMNKTQYDYINRLVVPICEKSTKLCNNSTNGSQPCVSAYYICQIIYHSIMTVAGDIHPYDIRRKCSTNACYDFSTMEKLLNQLSVKESLGVKKNIEFVSCSFEIHQAMIQDQMKSFDTNIPALLEDGIQVLIYAGEYDFLCNWIGNKRWVYAMEWSGRNKFVDSYILPFQVDGVEAGVFKNHGVLTFLKVHNAGHMVPMDQPKVALEMLARWTRGDLSKPLTDDATSKTTDLVSFV